MRPISYSVDIERIVIEGVPFSASDGEHLRLLIVNEVEKQLQSPISASPTQDVISLATAVARERAAVSVAARVVAALPASARSGRGADG